MKIYDASEISKAWDDAQAKDIYHINKYGPWEDDVPWKSLMYGDEHYTHVRTHDGLFVMSKWGPSGDPIKEAPPN